MTRLPIQDIASTAFRELQQQLVKAPPKGVSAEQVETTLTRLETTIVGALIDMVKRLLAADAPCSVCRRPRGTNRDCDRCDSFDRMRREKESPTAQAALRAELAEFQRSKAIKARAEEARLDSLRGRVVRVALVGCGSAKAATGREARNLYTGPLFRAARRYAELQCDDWVILSALHGVLRPEDCIEPYDRSLVKMRDAERSAWGNRVSAYLREHYRGLTVTYIGLAGEAYLSELSVGPIARPLEGMGIGERIKYLRQAGCGCRGQE